MGMEQMRSQLNILKQKLDRQTIANDRMIRQVMESKMSWIERFVWIEILVLLPLCFLIFLGITLLGGFPWWFFALTMVMLAADTAADYKINRMKGGGWAETDMVGARRRLVWMKKARLKQLYIEVPVVLVWYAAVVLGMLSPEKMAYPCGIVGGVICGVIGMAAGVFIIMRMQRTNDEIIRQIDEITKEDTEE